MSKELCFHPACTAAPVHRGWCIDHYPRCSETGCSKLVHSRGMCNKHYLEWYAHGDRGAAKPAKLGRRTYRAPKCTAAGCQENALARGLCTLHYRRLLRGTLDEREIAP